MSSKSFSDKLGLSSTITQFSQSYSEVKIAKADQNFNYSLDSQLCEISCKSAKYQFKNGDISDIQTVMDEISNRNWDGKVKIIEKNSFY